MPARSSLRGSLNLLHVVLTVVAFCLVTAGGGHGVATVRDLMWDGTAFNLWELPVALVGFAIMLAACFPLGDTRAEVVGCVGAAVTLFAWLAFTRITVGDIVTIVTSTPYLVSVGLFVIPRYRALLARRRSRRRGFEVAPAKGTQASHERESS